MRKNWVALVLSVTLSVALTSCIHEEPNVIYMPEMVYSPAFKAQKEGAMRVPVKGTVSRDFQPYPYKGHPEDAAKFLKNPLRPTRAVLERGQHIFRTYCAVC